MKPICLIINLNLYGLYLDTDILETLIFNKANFEAYIKQLLLVNHYRVEIFVNKGGKWALDFKVYLI